MYLIEILHQTTTVVIVIQIGSKLYLIEILHQTTTDIRSLTCCPRCILSKFYIKPQLCEFGTLHGRRCILSKFYIKPQHTANNNVNVCRCILSKFYIKPQQRFDVEIPNPRCILSKFYIKPQLIGYSKTLPPSCILSKFYIKPQLPRLLHRVLRVVSYRNSTSNHNSSVLLVFRMWLYLIEILHQTTTLGEERYESVSLYLIEILHQTTTDWLVEDNPA